MDLKEPLKRVIDALRGDSDLVAEVPETQIANHLPQDGPLPHIRVMWSPGQYFGDKGSVGYDGTMEVHIWTEAHGDKDVLNIMQLVMDVLNNVPLSTTSAQSLMLQLSSINTFIEPDGVSHHGVMFFRHIFTE